MYDARSYAGSDRPYVNRSKVPRMTRAHFEVVAGALAAAKVYAESFGTDTPAARTWDATVDLLADALANTNPRFERAAFKRACGVRP